MKAEARVKELETMVASLSTGNASSSASTPSAEQSSQLGELNKVRHCLHFPFAVKSIS